MSKQKQLQRELEGQSLVRGNTDNPLTTLIRAGKNAMPSNLRYNEKNDSATKIPGMNPKAQVNDSISLSRDLLPALISSENQVYRPSTIQQEAGQLQYLKSSLASNSRVLQAGANLILLQRSSEVAFSDKDIVAFEQHASEYITVEPANITAGTVDSNGEMTVNATELPVKSAVVDRENLTQRAVRFNIPRSTLKQKGEDQVSAEMMTSIALGIGRAIDNELLSTVESTTPNQFSIANAAAAGLRFPELKAVVGTSAAATTTENGQLYAGGVPAELSADSSQTIIGAFDRAAIALADEIQVIVERRNANGSLTVTCWLDIQALVANPSAFWIGA